MAIKLIPFDRFTVQYGITNPLGHDLVRVEFFEKKKLAARMLLGSAIAPGSFASLLQGTVHMYFPPQHFTNVLALLASGKGVAIQIESENEAFPDGPLLSASLTLKRAL